MHLKLLKNKKYETSPKIKQEFVDLLEWYYKMKIIKDEFKEYDLQNVVNTYLKEKDIALYGEIRKLHGVNTRNANFELLVGIGAAILGLVLATIFFLFF